MKFTYLATFLSGTAPIIEKSFKTTIPDIEIKTVLDGSIVFSTAENFQKLTSLGFVNNMFLLVKEYKPPAKTAFSTMIKWCKTNDLTFLRAFTKKLGFKNFRMRFVVENTSVSYDEKELTGVEQKIAREGTMQVNKLNPDTEVWFMQRSEGYSYILLRLTNNSQVEHRLKGQLRPELANIMCLLSEPDSSDIFIDPFAGYGTILEARQRFPAKELIGFEKDLSINGLIPVRRADFFKNDLKAGSVTKIVTDPPWGLFDKSLNIDDFYNRMFKEFDRILAGQGILVVLVNRDIDVQRYLKGLPLTANETYDILVSGKKATLYKIVKD